MATADMNRLRAPLAMVAVAAVALVLLAGAAELQALREAAYPPRTDDREWLYVQSGTAIRRLSASFSALSADVYWIRTLQHYGSTKRRLAGRLLVPEPPPMLAENEYPLLYPLLDITTTLDPRFKIAYRFGAVFLAESYPTGPGRPDLAQALLEKAIRAQPDKWEYMQDIGFVHYWYRNDYAAAASWFQKASEVSGSPWWLKSLAATTFAKGGDRQSSRVMWQAILQASEVDWLKQDAKRRLEQFDALDFIELLQARVDAFMKAEGHPPAGWADLIRRGVIQGVPIDPERVPFELSSDGRVRLSNRSRLWPLPAEPRRVRPVA